MHKLTGLAYRASGVIPTGTYWKDGVHIVKNFHTGVEFTVTKEDNTTWKFTGNGYKSSIDVNSIAEKHVHSDGSMSPVISGIRFDA